MAVRGFIITVATNAVAGQIDPLAKATTALTDLTSALAVGNISGDPTSVTAVTLVQTDVTALKAAINGNIVVLIDTAVVTTKNALNTALDAFKRNMEGSGLLT